MHFILRGNPKTPKNSWATHLALIYPAAIIGAFQVGRGVGNILLAIYPFVTLYLLHESRKIPKPPLPIYLFFGFILTSGASLIFFGIDKPHGIERWLIYVLATLSTFYATLTLLNKQIDVTTISLWLAIIAIGTAATQTGKLLLFLLNDGVNIASNFSTHNLSALAPLALSYFILNWWKQAAWMGLIITLLALGDSRTEALMALAAFATVYLFHYRKFFLFPLLLPVFFVITVVYGFAMRPDTLDLQANILELANGLSSRRIELWMIAFEHPPEITSIGAGFAQSRFHFLQHDYFLSAFHNAFLEMWFDGGWLGLGLYLVGFLLLATSIFQGYRKLTGDTRWLFSCFVGALVATIISGMLDRSYTSPLFNVFLPYCLIILYLFCLPNNKPHKPIETK